MIYFKLNGNSMNKQIFQRLAAAGLALIVIGAALTIVMPQIAPYLLTIGGVMCIVGYLRGSRAEKTAQPDERTLKIGHYGLARAWLATLALLCLLYLLNVTGLFNPDAQSLLIGLLLFHAVFGRATQWYFLKKGDISY